MRTPRLPLAFAMTALLFLTIAPATTSVATQGRQPAATARPGWLPRDLILGGPLTAAQKATAIATLEEIQRIDHPFIEQFFARRPDEEGEDTAKYLQSLTSTE